MRAGSLIFVLATVVVVAVTARGEESKEKFQTLLGVDDVMTHDHRDAETPVVRQARQNIRQIGVGRGPTVLIGNDFGSMASCLARCRELGYPGVLYRNRACRCRPPLNNIFEVDFD